MIYKAISDSKEIPKIMNYIVLNIILNCLIYIIELSTVNVQNVFEKANVVLKTLTEMYLIRYMWPV